MQILTVNLLHFREIFEVFTQDYFPNNFIDLKSQTFQNKSRRILQINLLKQFSSIIFAFLWNFQLH
jgi:hypothetical protein